MTGRKDDRNVWNGVKGMKTIYLMCLIPLILSSPIEVPPATCAAHTQVVELM